MKGSGPTQNLSCRCYEQASAVLSVSTRWMWVTYDEVYDQVAIWSRTTLISFLVLKPYTKKKNISSCYDNVRQCICLSQEFYVSED